MSVAIVSGAAGLIGSEASAFFAELGMDVIGLDNDMRRYFFGEQASTAWRNEQLKVAYPTRYTHVDEDIRNGEAIKALFRRYEGAIELVIHTAAQPSHDWAANEPVTDFEVNATGTLHLLEATRQYAPQAVFLFTSTNKVYGDTPNRLPLIELDTRWELPADHDLFGGIPESMSIDQSTHSLFGVSKVAADLMVQEYGRYFGLQTTSLRGGCLTGPHHSGAQLHGFLAYLMKCAATGQPYTVFGYEGKQVRDNIHSADLIGAMHAIFQAPRVGEVYNLGGGRYSHCSMREAIALCEEIVGQPLSWTYDEQHRKGDHIWYISDLRKFESHYPGWSILHDVPAILRQIYDNNCERWRREERAQTP